MNDKFRILHICPSFNNVIYSQLVERQMNLGNSVRVFYFRPKGTGTPNGDKSYVDAVMPYSNIDRCSFVLKEHKILNSFYSTYKNEFDFIHAHTLFSAGYIAYKAHKKWGIPYVVAVRATDITDFFKLRFYLRGLGIEILRHAEKIFFLAPAHKNALYSTYVSDLERAAFEEKTYLIPNGIDDFWLENASKNKNREPDNNIHIIYYGDINSNKNIETTIEACKTLISEGYHVKYYVIGQILEKKYEDIIKRNTFVEYKEFMPKEQLIDYLRSSDVLVMPSKSETFGLSYVEAMTQGVPIIYTEGQGFDEQFPEGIVGYHVNASDPQDVAAKIKLILQDYNSISNNCVHNIASFSWDTIANKYEELYREMNR